MPTKKGKGCVGDVMKEWKRGDLHSGTGKKGKKGPVVKSQQQAVAIALNTCNNNEMDQADFMCPDGDCGKCPYCKKKEQLVAIGYSEEAIKAVLPQLETRYGEKPGLWENIRRKRERIKRGSGERMRKPGEKGAPSAEDIREAGKDDKK